MKLRILLLLLSLLYDITPLLTLYSYSYCKSLLSFERNLSLPLEENLKRGGEEGDAQCQVLAIDIDTELENVNEKKKTVTFRLHTRQ